MAKRRQASLNTRIIGGKISEANEELAKLMHKMLIGKLKEAELQVGLQHAYHHLNFAWNARRARTSEYMSLTQKQFEKWGKYPSNIDEL